MTEDKQGTADERIWIPAPIKNNRWIPKNPGDSLIGKYLKKEPGTFRNKPNCKYFFETDNPAANNDGIAYLFGTEAINEGMKDIPPRYDVRIIYKGKKPQPDPKKKPYQIFEVCALMTKNDPLYQKWYPEEGESEAAPGPELQTQDHTKTDELIEQYKEVLSEGFKRVTCEAIIREAEADKELTAMELSNIKARVFELYKAGKIESEEE